MIPHLRPKRAPYGAAVPLSSDIVMSYQAKMSRPWHHIRKRFPRIGDAIRQQAHRFAQALHPSFAEKASAGSLGQLSGAARVSLRNLSQNLPRAHRPSF
jgi:hypothetical protein